MRDGIAGALRAIARGALTVAGAPARAIGRAAKRARRDDASGTEWAIVGLGNPGKKFDGTKHNVGFDVVDALAAAEGIEVGTKRHGALVGVGSVGGSTCVLAKPQTYMNLSGKSLREIMRGFSIPKSRVLVIYDDLETPLGELRMKASGTHGGHNGIRSVIDDAFGGARDFARVKVGIGRPKDDSVAVYEYVLSKFDADDEVRVRRAISEAAAAVRELLTEKNLDNVMTRVNTKYAPKKVKPPKQPKPPKERVFVTTTIDEQEEVKVNLEVRPLNQKPRQTPKETADAAVKSE